MCAVVSVCACVVRFIGRKSSEDVSYRCCILVQGVRKMNGVRWTEASEVYKGKNSNHGIREQTECR